MVGGASGSRVCFSFIFFMSCASGGRFKCFPISGPVGSLLRFLLFGL